MKLSETLEREITLETMLKCAAPYLDALNEMRELERDLGFSNKNDWKEMELRQRDYETVSDFILSVIAKDGHEVFSVASIEKVIDMASYFSE